MKNAAFKLVHGIGIVIHNEKNPSKEEWDAYLEMSAAGLKRTADDFSKVKQIIFTDGGGPNPAQRKASMALGKEPGNTRKVKVAVVSSSVVVRGIVTAFNWSGAPLRSFTPDKVEDAFAFLEVPNAAAADICDAVEELCSTVDGIVRSAARVRGHRAKLSS